MPIVEYTEVETRGIRIFCGLLATVNVLLLVIAIMNIRQLVILKVKRTSITIFYVFIVAGTTLTAATMLSVVISPIKDYQKGWFSDYRWQSLFFRVSITVSLLYGIEVYLIMQRLKLKIFKHYDLMGDTQAKCRKLTGYVVVGL